MTKTASPIAAKTDVSAGAFEAASDADYRQIQVRLRDLGLAPENLRFDEPADEGIPQLAATMAAAGLLIPPIVRHGRKGEPAFVALDGRRRRLALLLLRDQGRIDDDYSVTCRLAVSKAAQAAALVLPNAERAPVHLAEVIMAIGKFRKARMDTATIAKALGYDVLDIRRHEALASVDPKVLEAFRAGRLTLKQVKLLARIEDKAQQGQLAQSALDGYLEDYQLRARVENGKITVRDKRLTLVGLARYTAAGGVTRQDLFGEMPDDILDPDLLQRLWQERVDILKDALAPLGLSIFSGDDVGLATPDGFETLDYVHDIDLTRAQRAARAAAREAIDLAVARLKDGPLDTDAAIVGLVAVISARRDMAAAVLDGRELGALMLAPSGDLGVETRLFLKKIEVLEEVPDVEEIASRAASPRAATPPDVARIEVVVEQDGAGHGLHETRTDIATRGLIRDLADNPAAALTALVAQLFNMLALEGVVRTHDTALSVQAKVYSRVDAPPMPALDGQVLDRLEARRVAYLASGQRPIAFVDALPFGEKMALLAELVAVSLDLREVRNSWIRGSARAEAREIAALCDADLSMHWCADAAFLALHSKKQLLAMLSAMAVEDDRAQGLKKDSLVTLVAEAAAERRWAPAVLSWTPGAAEAVTEEEEKQGDGDETDKAAEPANPKAPAVETGNDRERDQAIEERRDPGDETEVDGDLDEGRQPEQGEPSIAA